MLTQYEREVLEGCLLGDGCLHLAPRCKTPYFSYTSKYKEAVQFVYNQFHNFNYVIKHVSYFDKRTQKEYSRYYFNTKVNYEYTKIYSEWYENGKKTKIPKNLILTPANCLFLYLGDGYIDKKYSSLGIATNCFKEQELVNIISPQLSELEPKIYVDKKKNQPIIIIPRKHSEKFLKYIGNCPVECYKYRWNYREYKSLKYKNNTVKHLTQDEIIEICELYNKSFSIYKISKTIGCDHSLVRYHLKKIKIYVPGRDKYEIKFSEDQLKHISILREENKTWKEIAAIYNEKTEDNIASAGNKWMRKIKNKLE